MVSENKEKKRKAAIALPSDTAQKPHKKPKSLENKNDPAASVQAAEAITTNESDKPIKPKHKPRKRAADFMHDVEDNAAGQASVIGTQKDDTEITEKLKVKKVKNVSGLSKANSNTADVQPTTGKDAELVRPKKSKRVASLPKDPVISPSDAPLVKSPRDKNRPSTSDAAKEKIHNTLDTPLPAPSKKSKKEVKAKERASASAGTLTADDVNGVVGKSDGGALEPKKKIDATSISMQVEGQVTAEKELEDEWGSDDEDDDQGAALLAGFDSDGEDNTKDVGLDAGKPIPKLSKKTSKKVKEAVQNGISDGPGTVYVGRIPHGFYETQMREYFSQFGTITKLRLSRNKTTGASKHFAFIEFESDEVAKIVAKTMDNYLMFGHILKCKYAPQERLHPETWKGANKRFRKVPYTMLEKRALEAPKTAEQWEKKNKKEQKKREQKAMRMKELGYEFKLPALREPREVLEQRKLQDEEQAKLLEAAQDVQDAPAGVDEPPNGLLTDEAALKVEEKINKKKKTPAQQQSVDSVVQATATPQPTEQTVQSHLENEKRDKRKEKKTKSKEAKAQQTQLDAQLLGDSDAVVGKANAALKREQSTKTEAEPLPEKKKQGEPANLSHPIGDHEKRKRRKSKDVKAGETAMPIAKQAAQVDASTGQPKNKKRKSANDAEPRDVLKKLSKVT